MAVGVAEAVLRNEELGASTEDLQRDEDQKNAEKDWAVQVEKQAGNGDSGKDVHGIANFGIKAVSDQGAGSRGERERVAKLKAGEGNENESADGEDEAKDVKNSPGAIGES